MKNQLHFLAAAVVLVFSAVAINAGTISYHAIPAPQSDANSGIGVPNQYTSAVDGGNQSGTDRVINGITLSALSANGQSITADNCTLNALSGSLINGGGDVQADGILQQVLSDLTFNTEAGDNSQQEIVLDPESLEAGVTYDLRVYVAGAYKQDRQVNLAFAGDDQDAVETGWFNEDDARSSAGKFTDAGQVYFINYRYTWDGDTTPGITITQKTGAMPFCLYALTNQPVAGAETAEAETTEEETTGTVAESAGAAMAAGADDDEGLSSGLINNESDEVGVQSDDFYGSDSLNSNGRWVDVDKWGKCWQPTNVSSGWTPYTNGTWNECDDCGWTFVSEEPWAWACYHFGRWCKVRSGCGWAWVPGKVWGASWVSWRRGRDQSNCSCIGWAPLPPEAGCEVGIGISSWVDTTCNIGPDCYTFVNIRDFGAGSYWGCGCIYDNSRNSTIIIDTFNCTNISYGQHVNIYCGGPDFNWCNNEIRKQGGKECGKVYVNKYDNPGKMGGKFSKHEGNQLGLVSPHIKGDKNPKHMPKSSEKIGKDKIDHGWAGVKDKKQEKELKNHLAEESKGKNPKNSPAKLPDDVAQKMGKHHGGDQVGAGTGAGVGNGLHPGGKANKGNNGVGAESLAAGAGAGAGQHPGAKGNKGNKGVGAESLVAGAGAGQHLGGKENKKSLTTGGADLSGQHPGGKGKNKGQGQGQGLLGNQAASTSSTGFNQHPGGKNKGKKATGGGGTNVMATQGIAGGTGGGKHPGQSLKGKKHAQGGTNANGQQGGAANLAQGQGNGGGQSGDKHKGKGAKQNGLTGNQGAGSSTNTSSGTGSQGSNTGQRSGKHHGKGTQGGTGTGGGAGAASSQNAANLNGSAGQGQGGGHKKHAGKTQGQGQSIQSQNAPAQTGGSGGGGKKHKQNQQATGGGQPQGGGGGGGGKGHKQQQQNQQQMLQGQGAGQALGGGGGGGGGGQRHHQQQQQVQGQAQPQQQGGGGKKKNKQYPYQ